MNPGSGNVENLGKELTALLVGGIVDRGGFKANLQTTVIDAANSAF